MTKRTLWVTGCFLALLAGPVQAQNTLDNAQQNTAVETNPVTLTVSPTNIVQGQQSYISLSAPYGKTYRIEVMGKSIPLSPADQDRVAAYIAVPADQKAGGYTLRILDEQNTEVARQKIEVQRGRFGTQNIRYRRPPVDATLKKKLDAEYALIDTARNTYTPERYFDNQFKLPVPHRITSVYGTRRRLNGKYNGYHGGVDFASPMGYPVKAPAAGVVTLANYFSAANANGNTIFLDHGMGVTSGYIHLSKLNVEAGQRVTQGQTIGYIGSTGRSTGPHLHWGVYLHGQNTDGLGWIRFTR